MTRRRGWSDITFTDQFCGAGGSSIGAMRIGLRGALAMNHWKQACETYATNNPHIPVDCADVSSSDPRKYPSTDILITSPECTTHSPAGGNRRSTPRDLFSFDKAHLDDPAFTRSRATMWDVPRFAEYHQYRAIIVENVVEVLRWELFPVWLAAMHRLGYRHKLVSLNSMFCHPTPQSRDRLYIVFWQKGNRAPDLDIRRLAPCPKHGNIEALQLWKNGRYVGKHRFQYVYACAQCAHPVTPYYYAALNAIDLTLPAERIGDRQRPLKPRTRERILYGLKKYGRRRLIVRTNMTSGVECRVRGLEEPHFAQTASWLDALVSPVIVTAGSNESIAPADRPMPSQTATERFGVAATVPFVVKLRGTEQSHLERSASGVDEALPTLVASGYSAALVSPGFLPFIAMRRAGNTVKGIDEPMPTCLTGEHHLLVQGAAQISLRDAEAMRVAGLDRELMTQGCAPQQGIISHAPFVVSHYGTNNASPIDAPVPSVTTIDRHSLVQPADDVDVDDCYFRMLQPHEIGAAMAFPNDYTVLGNKRDRVKQYGNAVTPPAMAELILRVVASLAPEVRR